VLRLIHLKKIPKVIELDGLVLPIRSCLTEIIIAWTDVELQNLMIKRVCNTVMKNNPDKKIAVLTGEMLTPFANMGLEGYKNIKTAQCQTTAILQVPQTNFVMCDLFVFKSTKEVDFFQRRNNFSESTLTFWGNLNPGIKMKLQSMCKRIVFFTQPYEKEDEFRIIRELFLKFPNLEITLKLHPRDNKKIYSRMFPELVIIDGSESIENYINRYNLAICRTSSISHDIIISGLPILFILTSIYDQTIKAPYLVDTYPGRCLSLESLINGIENYSVTVTSFNKFRTEYFEENGITIELETYRDNLLSQMFCSE
jgi:hypothetical protein